MATNGTIPQDAILNPYTPLAFLPPRVADQYQLSGYVYVATLAAYTWDWLMSIPEEYTATRTLGFNPPNIAYFVSRFGTLGFCISTTIFRVAPIADCAALRYVEGVFFEITLPATSLLFFFRVKAVYNNSRNVTAFFGIIWLAIVGLSVLIMFGIRGKRIPYTLRCTEILVHTYPTIPVILASVNDTLVFLAISCRMVSRSMANSTWSARVKSFVRGDGLEHLSKSLLQSGQAYYFATIGVGAVSVALILSPDIPEELHTLLCSVYFALSSAMACRVFRAVLLGIIKDPNINTVRLARPAASDSPNDDDDDGVQLTSKFDKSIRSSKLKVKVAVETNTKVESNDGLTFWEVSPGDETQRDGYYRV